MKNNFDLRKFLTENKLTSNTKTLNEAEEENWREEYPEAKNSWEYDDQGYGAVEAFFDDVLHKVGTDISLEDAKGLLDKRGEGGDDTKAFNQAVITQMQSTDEDEMDMKNTLNMLQAYEEKYNEPFNTNLITHLDEFDTDGIKDFKGYKAQAGLSEKFMGVGDDLYTDRLKGKGVTRKKDPKILRVSMGPNAEQEQKVIDIARDAIALMDEQPGTSAEAALAAALEGLEETAPGYMHDCAAKVMHEKYGNGDCIPEEHTLVKEGNKYVVTHYDVLFESGKTVKNIPVGELKIITESHHGHKRRKK
mgnify:CR=1 FL=1|jgi:hypothetical protein